MFYVHEHSGYLDDETGESHMVSVGSLGAFKCRGNVHQRRERKAHASSHQ